MRRVYPCETWPESWQLAYRYDLEEIYGEITHRGEAYAYQNRKLQTLRLLEAVLAPGATVLDIAAAQGNFSLALAELGYVVTWNDLRAELADYVRAKYERGVLHFAPGNAFELEFASRFDAVLITEVIEHVAHPDEFLRNAARLLKPGGYMVMTTPNGGYFRNSLPRFSECADPSVYESIQFGPNSEHHIFLLHCDEVRALAGQAGLLIEEMVLFTNPLTNGHVKLGTALKCLPKTVVDRLEGLSVSLPDVLKTRLMVQMGVRFRLPG